MQELRSDLKQLQQEKTEVVAKKQHETQYQHAGAIKPKAGQKVFEINTVTGEVREAEYKKSSFQYEQAVKGDLSPVRELVINDGCVYIPALNKANALKHYRKAPNQSAYYQPAAVSRLSFQFPSRTKSLPDFLQ